MVRITHGLNNLTLEEIALRHWGMINPKKQNGEYYASQSLVGRVSSLLECHLANNNIGEANFYQSLLDHEYEILRRIITCNANELPAIIEEVTRLLDNCNLLDDNKIVSRFSDELLDDVFQYANWRSNGNGNELFSLMDISVCPYCNLAHVFHDEDAGKLIVSYDHYYDKGTYPYLALTFSNLIPACSTCNQNYKSIFQFKIETHLHPYLDDYNSKCAFAFSYLEFTPNSNIVIDVIEDEDNRSPRYNLDFSLSSRYNIDDIKRNMKSIFHLSKQYDETYKNSMLIMSGLQSINEVEASICETWNIPFNPREILQNQYGKLKRDIAFQTGLLTTQ